MAAPTDTKTFTNKVVLITGASSGIGASTAVLFAKHGAQLSLTGRNETNLKKIGKECEQHGAKVLQILADVTKEDDNKRIVDDTVKHFGQIDVLVPSAGIYMLSTPISETSMEFYDKMMNVNLRSVFNITNLAIPHLKKTKGCIVNVSSLAGIRSFGGVATYCMSKAALDSFTRCAALELAPFGVRVNSVNPGTTDTGIHMRAGMDEENYKKRLEGCKTSHPLGRAGQPDEVAQAIVFLASDASSFTSGVQFPVDGGRQAMCPR